MQQTCMLFFLALDSGTNHFQKFFLRHPTPQSITQRHFRVAMETHLTHAICHIITTNNTMEVLTEPYLSKK